MFSFRNRTPQPAPSHNISVPSSPQRSEPADVTHGLIDLSLRLIDPDADNGRGDDEHENISELTDSIRTQGVLQPILVRPTPHDRYRIVAGERRYRAAMLVAKEQPERGTIRAIVSAMTDEEAMAIQIIENEQRKDINIVAKAEKVKRLIASIAANIGTEIGANQDAARQLGKSNGWISQQKDIANLPDDIKALVKGGKVESVKLALELNKLGGDHRANVFQALHDGTYTTSMLEPPKKPRRPRPPCEARPAVDGTAIPAVQPNDAPAGFVFALPGRESAIRLIRGTGYAVTLDAGWEDADDARILALLVAADGWLHNGAHGVFLER